MANNTALVTFSLTNWLMPMAGVALGLKSQANPAEVYLLLRGAK
jgi:hypothetical protein